MGDNPKWLKRRVRARMAETGEKYTTALRHIQAELEEKHNREQDGTPHTPER
jgi:hypothetical protein